jgi:protein SCO1/2
LPKSLAARLSLVLSAVAILALLGTLAWYQFTPQLRGEGDALIGGPFTLINQHGETVTDESLRGQYLLIYFGYTYCPDVCPTELQAMSQAVDQLGADGAKVTPVFITVDPARDTAEQLAAYAPNFHPRLLALTGSAQQIADVAGAYRVYYKKAEDDSATDYLMDHSSIIYLMGPDGAFLTHFAYGTTPDEMAEGVRKYL